MINPSLSLKFLLSSICLFLLTSYVASAETIELGGPRRVVAEFTSQADGWIAILRMIPVKCFNQAMNTKVQKQLGCDYALTALTRLLQADAISVSSCRCEGMSEENGIVTMTIRIGGVHKQTVNATHSKKSEGPRRQENNEERQGSLLSCADDWSHIIDNFKQAVLDEGNKVFAHSPFDDENALALAEWEEEFRSDSRAMQEKLKSDIELLSVEREELLTKLNKCTEEVLDQMKRCGELLECAEHFQDVTLDSAFASALLSDPILMEVGGVKVLTTIDGTRMVISVGTTEIREPSAKETLRQKKVAQMRAESQLVRWTESHVSTRTTMKEEHRISTNGSGVEAQITEDFQEITKEEAEGIVKGMAPIGTWSSLDNQIFYLAIGRIL